MIDLHAHILPGLDDGPKNMDEALEMCRVAQADGIHTIVATPHHRIGVYDNSQTNILPALESLQQALHREVISIRIFRERTFLSREAPAPWPTSEVP